MQESAWASAAVRWPAGYRSGLRCPPGVDRQRGRDADHRGLVRNTDCRFHEQSLVSLFSSRSKKDSPEQPDEALRKEQGSVMLSCPSRSAPHWTGDFNRIPIA